VVDVPRVVAQVAASLRSQGISPEGPLEAPPARVPPELEGRVSSELRTAWARGVSRLSWQDHDEQRLGRDARHGGIWFMTPGEAAAEAREYATLIDDERTAGDGDHLELAERTWHLWTPFHRFPSGDLVAVAPEGPVFLWQHDLLDGGPYSHGLCLGSTFSDFVETWARVGFAEPRDWRRVATTGGSGLDLDGADWRLLL
jgi:hypothetical protein